MNRFYIFNLALKWSLTGWSGKLASNRETGKVARKHKRRKSNSLKQIYCKPLASGQPGGSQRREMHFNNITLGFENGGVERQYSFPKSYQKPISE